MNEVTPNYGVPMRTIISQYRNSPTLVALINSLDESVCPRADLEQFIELVWDVQTANDFGLEIWGRIVGIGRYLTVPGEQVYLGFAEAYTYELDDRGTQPFGFGPFYDGIVVTQTFRMDTEAYRMLILAKAAANISDGTAPSLNNILLTLFGTYGRCYVADWSQMRMGLVFEFQLEPWQRAIIKQSDLIPRPAGVLMSLAEVPADSTFGFAEAGVTSSPFSNGSFFPGVVDASQ
ncbi:DUF2612 domain-containing protein [Bordetella sp. 02P26C-1]|uniref:DUF2612 domain-containing protein n=1 Tax=Bordetella sp. 02P26C-1 TaxID=2683195 RepID=UPI0013544DEE|nr:DUF2612 domain-containing protein [Bordetella sp. 02P26C-1]MVW80167.1 DUF2612 domain-containing protein [Bordetella sp. 02P26C-1]